MHQVIRLITECLERLKRIETKLHILGEKQGVEYREKQD